MSQEFPSDRWDERFTAQSKAVRSASAWPHRLALLAGLVLIGSFLSVLYHITTVVGGLQWLAIVVGGSFVLATIAARLLPLRAGLAVGVLLLTVGVSIYVLALPNTYLDLVTFRLFEDVAELLLGELSLIQIIRADLWAIVIAPAPVFGTWYVLSRRRYDLAASIGGLTLGFFVLAGNPGEAVKLVGVTSAMAVLGFGSLDRAGLSWGQLRDVGLVLAIVIVVTRLASPVTARLMAVPANSLDLEPVARSSASTVEGNLLDAPGSIGVQGSISLSSTVRFTIAADRPALWHVAAYDRFTGGGWVRTGGSVPYDGAQSTPRGETETIDQTVTVHGSVNTMPAAWKPVRVDEGVADRTRVTDLGGLQPTGSFADGDAYSVTSQRPVWTPEQLREAGEGLDDFVRYRYLQVPNDTPSRVGRFAAEITADADNWFDAASAIEAWLLENKDYSLEVDRPADNVADAFIFEMDRGYCVYFATAMVIMLRTLDVPARFAVGYTTGEPVDDGEWVVRGFNSHAWVEAFFPGTGWVPFDPTPSEPRRSAQQRQLETDRAENQEGVDTDRTRPATGESSGPGDGNATEAPGGAQIDFLTPGNTSTLGEVDERQGLLVTGPDEPTTIPGEGPRGEAETAEVGRRALFTDLSTADHLAVFAGVVGVALGATRLHLLRRGVRFAQLAWQPPTDSPQADVIRAFDRLEGVLASQYRPRRSGETRREYVRALRTTGCDDDRVKRVLDGYELAVYKGEVTREGADEIVRLVDDLVRDRLFPDRLTDLVGSKR